jgi:hypothetical protein
MTWENYFDSNRAFTVMYTSSELDIICTVYFLRLDIDLLLVLLFVLKQEFNIKKNRCIFYNKKKDKRTGTFIRRNFLTLKTYFTNKT